MDERIKLLRKILGFTQQEFAEKIGVKRNTVAQYEIGRNPPTDTVVQLICREFNVSEAWLRSGAGDMFVHQNQEDDMAALIAKQMADKSDTFRQRLLSVLLRFDPDGPEWQVLEGIYEAIKKAQG